VQTGALRAKDVRFGSIDHQCGLWLYTQTLGCQLVDTHVWLDQSDFGGNQQVIEGLQDACLVSQHKPQVGWGVGKQPYFTAGAQDAQESQQVFIQHIHLTNLTHKLPQLSRGNSQQAGSGAPMLFRRDLTLQRQAVGIALKKQAAQAALFDPTARCQALEAGGIRLSQDAAVIEKGSLD